MKQAYLERLKIAEDASLVLHPDEALDQWIEKHFPHSKPPYLDIAFQVPSGLRMLCMRRGFVELERACQ